MRHKRSSTVWFTNIVSLLGSVLIVASVNVDPAGAAPAAAAPAATPAPPAAPRSITTLDGKPVQPSSAPFLCGEHIEYEVTWFGIKGGIAAMDVAGKGTFEGQEAIHLKATAVSSKAFSLFIKVEDVGESWIHPKELFSLGYVTNQSEGSRSEVQRVVLDNTKALALSHQTIRKKGEKVKYRDRELPLDKTHVQDALSMLYYIRAFDLKPGRHLVTDVQTSKKVWTLKVDALGKDTVQTPAGTYNTIRVRPIVEYQGKPQNRGKLTMWLTDDEARIPVKIQSDVRIGKVNATLIRYGQGANSADKCNEG